MRRGTAVPYIAAFIILAQVAIDAALPLSFVYAHRMDYNIVKDNLSDIGTTLDLLARHIRDEGLTEYVILLGDSAVYSGPGGPEQSVSRYMEDIALANGLPTVFNLAIPAAQMGDFYTLLLMLDERGVSTDHVVMNLIYSGFVERDPDPPIVYWLERDLERLDPEIFGEVAADLSRSAENKDRPSRLEFFLESVVYSKVPSLKYRDFLRAAVMKVLGTHESTTGDVRPWFEKPYIREAMKGPVYERQFDPSPLTLDDSNQNVRFMEKIIEHQRGKSLFIYMSPLNTELTRDASSSPGFARNMEALNTYMAGIAWDNGFEYGDFTSAIPNDLFSDHLHLIAEGYHMLAGVLWERLEMEGWFR